MNPRLFRVLHRAKHWRNRALLETVQRVEQNQWLSSDELAALAWEQQKKLVAHAYANCPFYREKYDSAGFHLGDLGEPEDFALVPLLTKSEVRIGIERMVAEGIDSSRLIKKFTGGSTGVPLMVYGDKTSGPIRHALYLRTIGAWGLEWGVKTAHIWGLSRLNLDYLYTRQTWWQRFLRNYVLLDAFDMTPQKMAEFANLLQSFKPDLVISYTSAMAAFARFLEEQGGPGFRPRAIWLTSEPIHDFQKELVERVFQSTVYDQYGSVEILSYAAECTEREGLHINADMRTVEVVDEMGHPLPLGERGQVVVTDLVNYATPLIRYRNEDVANLLDRPCPCGRGLPLMSKVTGRIYDMFVLPDGSQIYGHRFTTFFYEHVHEVSNFQVHQTRKDRVIVRVVPTQACQPEILSTQILEAFRDYTKAQVHFEIRFVDTIPKEASGKYRFAKSDVSNPDNTASRQAPVRAK